MVGKLPGYVVSASYRGVVTSGTALIIAKPVRAGHEFLASPCFGRRSTGRTGEERRDELAFVGVTGAIDSVFMERGSMPRD